MKILLTHSDPELPARQSIDLWRIIRPFNELKKHVDWQFDSQPYPIDPNLINSENKVDTKQLVKEIERLGQYDIVWSSYFPDATLFDVMCFVSEKYGTKFVLDVDDDMFHIPKHNNIWNAAGEKGVKDMQYMIEQSPYLVTSCFNLQTEYNKHRNRVTYVFPNYVGDYKHPKFDNGDKVVISFFGSVTHKHDLEDTGFIEALQQIMNKYKNVYVQTVGCKIDKYLPKARYSHNVGKAGDPWITEVWPSINADIAVAPLIDDTFNRSKTNIKWLETAMIPAAFIGSNIPPYKGTVEHGKTGLLVDNSVEGWYEALEKLVTDEVYRKKLAKQGKAEIEKNWSIENNWQVLKNIVEAIHEDTDNRHI